MSSNISTRKSLRIAASADKSVWVDRKIAILGKPGSGKSAFIKALKEVPLEKRDGNPVYRKTIGREVHPIMVQYVQEGDMKVRISKTVWEFGHYVDPAFLNEMDGIVLIGKCPQDTLPDIPTVRIPRESWKNSEDALKIIAAFE